MQTEVFLMFPGQGSQFIGMGKDLEQEFTEFKHTLEEASDTLSFDMKELCFEDPEGKLNLTEFTQPSILTISIGILRILQKQAETKVNFVAGHSLGEYSALVALGALNFKDALKAVHVRGQAMQKAVPVGTGSMAAYLGQNTSELEQLCKQVSNHEEKVEIANYNCPGQIVLSGHKIAVEKICQVIAEKKLGRAKTLPVSAPFHSSLMKPAAQDMTLFFKNITLNPFQGKIIANIDAEIYGSSDYNKEVLIKQISSPVCWTQSLLKASAVLKNSLWIEVGPGKILQGLAKKTVENQECLVTSDLTNVKEVINRFK